MFSKRLLLLLACLLTLTACGASKPEAAPSADPVQTQAAGVVPEPKAAPTTEPALSPEELLLSSLPDTVKAACDLGLVELSMLTDLDRIVTGAEAAQLVQNAYSLHFGQESVTLNQVPQSEFADIECTRYWLAQAMLIPFQEAGAGAPYETFTENLNYLLFNPATDSVTWNDMFLSDARNVGENKALWPYPELDENGIVGNYYDFPLPDFDPAVWWKDLGDRRIFQVEYGTNVFSWTTMAYDRVTGEKILQGDQHTPFGFREKVSVQEAVEACFRYYRSFRPVPEMLSYEEIPAYDTSIITEELLTRETTLPEASCAYLPKEWRGVQIGNLVALDMGAGQPDMMIQENELQIVKDAGFNYVEILFDFHYYMSGETEISAWENCPDNGQMNESRLKELDQIIALCMEKDIHVNLSCTDVAGWNPQTTPPARFADVKNAASMARQWQVLARRYAAIPNRYLSFTLFHEPDIRQEVHYLNFFTPVVEAIREVSPDRCLIANVVGSYTAETVAQLGVALSTDVVWPEDFHIDPGVRGNALTTLFETAAWPYEKNGQVMDAESAMTHRMYNFPAPDAMAVVAEQYGVGYMVSSWSPDNQWRVPNFRDRFTDETMERYLTDFYQVLEDRGYGWCYGSWTGFTGIACAYPMVGSTTYTQVGKVQLYIDDEIFSWFQTLNGV